MKVLLWFLVIESPLIIFSLLLRDARLNLDPSHELEAIWDDKSITAASQAALQAGESIRLVCRLWSSPTQSTGSIFLFCPLSQSYCAQNCQIVNSSWPLECRELKQRRGGLSGGRRDEWIVRELTFTLSIATINAAGSWNCASSGSHSNKLSLHVRDRPVIMSLTVNPSNPVMHSTNVNLTCQAASSPNSIWYSFEWSGPQPTSKESRESSLQTSNTRSILTIKSVKPSDAGLYTCRIVTSQQTTSGGGGGRKWTNSRLTSDEYRPAIKQIELIVLHPPNTVQLIIHPSSSAFRVNDQLRIECSVEGGIPRPTVRFFQLGGKEAVNYFDPTDQSNLVWSIKPGDHKTKLGCSANSRIMQEEMMSNPQTITVIFPPGPPIISASPEGAVSENRSKAFTCQSASGSNPPARINWKLLQAVDFVSSLTEGSVTMRELEIEPHSLVRLDSDNQGQIAQSRAWLTARTELNGARIQCNLEWSDEGRSSSSNPASLSLEVLFAPKAVSLTADPRSGIRESTGIQTFTCRTSSSNPTASISWLWWNPTKDLSFQSNQLWTTRLIEYSTLNDLLNKHRGIWSTMANQNVSSEILPGVNGGRQTIGRLTISNVSRRQHDGWLLACKVDHLEWPDARVRLHQLNVLDPPELRIEIRSSSGEDAKIDSHSILECIPKGGKPRFEVHQQTHQVNLLGNNLWKVAWKFTPFFSTTSQAPEGDVVKRRLSRQPIKLNETSLKLTLSIPGMGQVGKYRCEVEGPAGVSFVERIAWFAFQPKLALHPTDVEAPLGAQAILQLPIWLYPLKFDDDSERRCELQPIKQRFAWFKVDSDQGKVKSRQLVTRSNINSNQDGLASGVVVITNSSILVSHSDPHPVPLAIYRLVIDRVDESSYGRYMCEIHHGGSLTNYFIDLKRIENSPIDMDGIRLVRSGPNIKLNVETVKPVNSNDRQSDFNWILLRSCLLPTKLQVFPFHECPSLHYLVLHSLRRNSGWFSTNLAPDFIDISPQRQCKDMIVQKDKFGNAFVNLNLNSSVESNSFLTEQHVIESGRQWDESQRLAYQFRLYDQSGSLRFKTSWLLEGDNEGEPKEIVPQSSTWKMQILWAILGIGICAITTVLLSFFLLKRRQRRKTAQPSLDSHSLAIIKNPMYNGNRLPHDDHNSILIDNSLLAMSSNSMTTAHSPPHLVSKQSPSHFTYNYDHILANPNTMMHSPIYYPHVDSSFSAAAESDSVLLSQEIAKIYNQQLVCDSRPECSSFATNNILSQPVSPLPAHVCKRRECNSQPVNRKRLLLPAKAERLGVKLDSPASESRTGNDQGSIKPFTSINHPTCAYGCSNQLTSRRFTNPFADKPMTPTACRTDKSPLHLTTTFGTPLLTRSQISRSATVSPPSTPRKRLLLTPLSVNRTRQGGYESGPSNSLMPERSSNSKIGCLQQEEDKLSQPHATSSLFPSIRQSFYDNES